MKNFFKRFQMKIRKDNERGARENLIEDLFHDFNRNRVQVYKMNFVRGLFFGFGSVLGGTVLIALLAWILGFFVNIPGIGESLQQAQDTIQSEKQ